MLDQMKGVAFPAPILKTERNIQNKHAVLTSCIIDVIHSSPPIPITPWMTLANRGAVGETLVTPSGQGLVKIFICARKQTTHQQQQFWLEPQQLIPVVWDHPQSRNLAFLLEVCGLAHEAKREVMIADLCLANKELQNSTACRLSCATHFDSSASVKRRLRMKMTLRPSAGSDVTALIAFFCLHKDL